MKIGLHELANSRLYVELKEEFRKLIKEKINEKFKSLKQFAVQSEVMTSSGLFFILEAKRHTQLNIWLKICEILSIELSELKRNILKIRSKNKKSCFIRSEQLPISPSSELALLVGHGIEDGHLNKISGCFAYTNIEVSLHNHISKVIYKLFNCSKYNKTESKGVPSRIYDRVIGDVIHLIGVPRGNKVMRSFLVPEWIMKSSKEIKKSFIRALFDDEGTVKVNSKELLIKFSKNKRYIASLQKFMEQIKQLLEDLGIEVTSIRKGNLWSGKNGNTIQLVLGIHGYENFVKFSKEIRFNHKQKQRELEKMINGYKCFPHKKGKVQSVLYENLREPQTIFNLMNKLNMSYIATYKNLKKLEKIGVIKKVEYIKNQPAIWKKIK